MFCFLYELLNKNFLFCCVCNFDVSTGLFFILHIHFFHNLKHPLSPTFIFNYQCPVLYFTPHSPSSWNGFHSQWHCHTSCLYLNRGSHSVPHQSTKDDFSGLPMISCSLNSLGMSYSYLTSLLWSLGLYWSASCCSGLSHFCVHSFLGCLT